jgi:hypothetical protein
VARALRYEGPSVGGSRRRQKGEQQFMTCDYNGWNDAPEDEREWFDQHPEIWDVAGRDNDARPHHVTRTRPTPRHRGGMAA